MPRGMCVQRHVHEPAMQDEGVLPFDTENGDNYLQRTASETLLDGLQASMETAMKWKLEETIAAQQCRGEASKITFSQW